MKPQSVTELMLAAAEALNAHDAQKLMDLREHIRTWVQSDEEADAQDALLQSMIAVLDALL